MVTISPARPSWQRGPVFKFFASLKLAVVLLAVLIVAAIAGTIWESSFAAKVERPYGYRAEFLHRPPTPQHPRDLGRLASGARLSVIDYAEAIDAKLNPRPLDSGGMPALHFTIKTAMMGQQLESWLLADNAQNGNFAMG